ncbi:hypothetical protein [Helicobacter sp. T3_23-1056]
MWGFASLRAIRFCVFAESNAWQSINKKHIVILSVAKYLKTSKSKIEIFRVNALNMTKLPSLRALHFNAMRGNLSLQITKTRFLQKLINRLPRSLRSLAMTKVKSLLTITEYYLVILSVAKYLKTSKSKIEIFRVNALNMTKPPSLRANATLSKVAFAWQSKTTPSLRESRLLLKRLDSWQSTFTQSLRAIRFCIFAESNAWQSIITNYQNTLFGKN